MKVISKKARFLIMNESDLTYTIGEILHVSGEADKISVICLRDRSSNQVGGEESQHTLKNFNCMVIVICTSSIEA